MTVEQGSPEWLAMRVGKVTASRVADIFRRTKTGYSTSRKNYAAFLLCERLTGVPTEGFKSAEMNWGIEKEPEARAAYEFLRDVSVVKTDFVDHPSLPLCGASPDGLVGDDGLIEIKCPNTVTHINTLTTGEIDEDYIAQMQWQMACTGRQWCDFVSYDPRLPPHLRTFIKRVPRDQMWIATAEVEVVKFQKEIEEMAASLPKAGAQS